VITVGIREDLLSENAATILKGLDGLDAELRKKADHRDTLDRLLKLSRYDNEEIVQKATWCAAKMGQNKVNDKRIISLMIEAAVNGDPEVRENAAWGIGEAAGTIEINDVAVAVILSLLDDANCDTRAMAAWAAGRLRHKTGNTDAAIENKLKELLNDVSAYVRMTAEFALE